MTDNKDVMEGDEQADSQLLDDEDLMFNYDDETDEEDEDTSQVQDESELLEDDDLAFLADTDTYVEDDDDVNLHNEKEDKCEIRNHPEMHDNETQCQINDHHKMHEDQQKLVREQLAMALEQLATKEERILMLHRQISYLEAEDTGSEELNYEADKLQVAELKAMVNRLEDELHKVFVSKLQLRIDELTVSVAVSEQKLQEYREQLVLKEKVLEESKTQICMLSEDLENAKKENKSVQKLTDMFKKRCNKAEKKAYVDRKKISSAKTKHEASVKEQEQLKSRIADLETQLKGMKIAENEATLSKNEPEAHVSTLNTQMCQSTQTEETVTENERKLISKMIRMERGYNELLEYLMMVELEYKNLDKKKERAKQLYTRKLTKAEQEKVNIMQELDEVKDECMVVQYKLDNLESTLAIPFTPTILSAIASAAAMERTYHDFYQGQPMPPMPPPPINQRYTLPMQSAPCVAEEPMTVHQQFASNQKLIIQVDSPSDEFQPEPSNQSNDPQTFNQQAPINPEATNQNVPIDPQTTKQEFVEPQLYHQLPMQPQAYEQRPIQPDAYQQLPMQNEAYGQGPMMPDTYQQLPMQPGTYQQLPMQSGAYGQAYQQTPVQLHAYQQAQDHAQAYQQAQDQAQAYQEVPVEPEIQQPGLQPGYIPPTDSFCAYRPGSHRFMFRDVYDNRRCRWCWTALLPRNTVQCQNCAILVHNSCKKVMPFTCGYAEPIWAHYNCLPVSHTELPATPSFKFEYPACWVIIHRELSLRRYIVIQGADLYIYREMPGSNEPPHEIIPLQMCGLMPRLTIDLTGRARVRSPDRCIAYHQFCTPGRVPGITFILEFGNYWDREAIIDALTSFIASLTPPGPFDHYQTK